MKLLSSDLSLIFSVIQERTGLRLSDIQQQDVERLLQNPQFFPVHIDLNDLPIVLMEQTTDTPIWQCLIRCVTVGETYFFRNQAQFEALRTSVLPTLIEQKRRQGQLQLRLWSAGCATGEEPFSLAMMLRDLLPDIDSWQITILATDINGDNLERARCGIYRAWSFRNETLPDIQTRWFIRKGESFQISPAIQRMVQFKLLNLVSEHYPSFESGTMNMDLILCRNVTIYFDQETTQSIAERFHKALNHDGWLVVGHAEPMSSVYLGFCARNFPNTVLYQKAPSINIDIERTTSEPSYVSVDLITPAPALPAQPAKVTEPTPAPTPEVVSTWEKAKQAADAEQWDNSLMWLKHAEAENKFQPQIYQLRALVQWQLGDLESALMSLRQAIYCDANFSLAHYMLADLSQAKGDHKSAVRHWKLAQQAIQGMEPQERLPFAEDLTVEMMQSLLAHRLSGFETANKEISR